MSELTGKVKLTQVRSVIGTVKKHRDCIRGLGLRRISQTIIVADTPQNRGMINKVRYLVKCESI